MNMETQIHGRRKPSQQDWSIGNKVKVGFLTFIVESKDSINGKYILSSICGKKKYEYIPHNGIYKIDTSTVWDYVKI